MDWLRAQGKRIYSGESTAHGLVQWLNANPGKRGERLSRLLRILRDLRVLEQESRSDTWDYRDLLLQFAEVISDYHLTPKLVVLPAEEMWQIKWTPVRRNATKRPGRRKRFEEGDGLMALIDLGKSGLATRVRQCRHCNKWFYARVEHGRFCRRECQQEYFRHSEEFKLTRREYMRRYRNLQRTRHVK